MPWEPSASPACPVCTCVTAPSASAPCPIGASQHQRGQAWGAPVQPSGETLADISPPSYQGWRLPGVCSLLAGRRILCQQVSVPGPACLEGPELCYQWGACGPGSSWRAEACDPRRVGWGGPVLASEPLLHLGVCLLPEVWLRAVIAGAPARRVMGPELAQETLALPCALGCLPRPPPRVEPGCPWGPGLVPFPCPWKGPPGAFLPEAAVLEGVGRALPEGDRTQCPLQTPPSCSTRGLLPCLLPGALWSPQTIFPHGGCWNPTHSPGPCPSKLGTEMGSRSGPP